MCPTASGTVARKVVAYKDQDRARNRRHRQHHHLKQFGTGHAVKIGAHHQRAFDHTEEHVGPPERPTTPETPRLSAKQKGQAVHQPAQDPPSVTSSAASAEKTITSGRIWKAITSGGCAPSFSAKGQVRPAEIAEHYKDEPLSVACSIALTAELARPTTSHTKGHPHDQHRQHPLQRERASIQRQPGWALRFSLKPHARPTSTARPISPRNWSNSSTPQPRRHA